MFQSLRRLTLFLFLIACGSPGDTPRLFNSKLPQGVVGLEYSASISARGGTGTLTYDIVAGSVPRGLSFSASGELSGVPAAAGEFSFSVEVRDRRGSTDRASFGLVIVATDPFELPDLTVDDLYTDSEFSHSLQARGGTAPLHWAVTDGTLPPGVTLTEEGVLSGIPEATGDYPSTVTVTDADERTATRDLSLSVFAPPELVTSALAPATAGAAYSQEIEHTGGKAPLTLTMSGTLPDGLQWSGTGLTGTPTAAGTASLTFELADANDRRASTTLSLQVHDRVVVTTTTLAPGHTSRPYSGSIVAAGGLPPYRFAITSGALPSGLTLSESGVLAGTPAAKGEYAFTVHVTDARDEGGSLALTLEVFDPLALTAPALVTAYTGEAYQASWSATGGKPPYVFTATPPVGLTLSAIGVLSGMPTATGDHPLSVKVVDALDDTVTASTTLKVRAPVTLAPAVLADAYRGSSYAHAMTATGGEGPLSWSVSSGTLPQGLSLSSAGEVSGLVAAGATGGPFTLRATDTNGRFAEQSLTLAVYSPPQLTTLGLPVAHPGEAFDQTLSTVGGKAPLSFFLSSGALPAGLSLDASTGRISGTPQAIGTSSFVVQVSDANGRTGEQSLTLEVTATGATALLDVASWNIEWFGDRGKSEGVGNGPEDDDLQRQKAAQVISGAQIPVWGLVEMVDAETPDGQRHFTNLLAGLPGYAGFLANHPSVTWGSAYYAQAEQKPGFLYDASRLVVESASLILTEYDATFAGRPPLRVDTVIDVDGHGVEVVFIVLHLKASKDLDSYTKRLNASFALKDYLDTYLPTENVLVVGDWNDDVDESITWDSENLTRKPTPFENFVTDTADYAFLTSVLSAAGTTSTVAHGEMIDHHLATDELAAWQVGSSYVLRPDLWPTPVTNYSSTTSDHYPVVSSFSFSVASPARLILNEVLFDEPSGAGGSPLYAHEFVEIRNVGGSTADLAGWSLSDAQQTRHVFSGTLEPGAALVVFSEAVAAMPNNAVTSSTGTLSLHPQDRVRLIDPQGVAVDTFEWSADWGDGISANRSPDGSADGVWLMHTELSTNLSSPGVRVDGSGF